LQDSRSVGDIQSRILHKGESVVTCHMSGSHYEGRYGKVLEFREDGTLNLTLTLIGRCLNSERTGP